MIVVKVTYTVKAEFTATNQKNISAFVSDLQKRNNPDLRYEVFLKPDGKTFMHVAAYSNEKTQREFLEMESFKLFQQKRDESGLEVEPVIEQLNHIASSKAIIE
jgi:hypothetical protein